MQKTILCICVSIIIISILFTLVPNSNMESPMRFTLNVFLISIILMPILIHIGKLNFSKYSNIIENNKFLNENIEKKIFKNNEKNLEHALKIVFSQNGYNDLDISININKDSKTPTITVKIPKEKNYDEEKIKQLVEKETGITPKLEFFKKKEE